MISAAQRKAAFSRGKLRAPVATYMVILDNFADESGSSRYSLKRLPSSLAALEWAIGVPKPVIMVVRPLADEVVVDTYRDFKPVGMTASTAPA